jgi:hypothetical protein
MVETDMLSPYCTLFRTIHLTVSLPGSVTKCLTIAHVSNTKILTVIVCYPNVVLTGPLQRLQCSTGLASSNLLATLIVGLGEEYSERRRSANRKLCMARLQPLCARGFPMTCAVVVSKFRDTLRNSCKIAEEAFDRRSSLGFLRDVVGREIEFFAREFHQFGKVGVLREGDTSIHQDCLATRFDKFFSRAYRKTGIINHRCIHTGDLLRDITWIRSCEGFTCGG